MSTVAFASAVMHIPTGNSRTADTIDGAAPPQTADGSLTVTVVPPVGGHSIEMSPFCASIRRLAVGRPSPVPPALVVKNGVKILSRTSREFQGPGRRRRSDKTRQRS